MFHRFLSMSQVKLNKDFVQCHYLWRLPPLLISIYPEIITLRWKLLITNSGHVSLTSDSLIQLNRYDINQPAIRCLNILQHSAPNLCNFFDAYEQIHCKLCSICLILLQWVYAASVDDQSLWWTLINLHQIQILLYSDIKTKLICFIKSRIVHTMVCYTKQAVPNFY